MKIYGKSLVIIFTLIILSCKGQKSIYSYKECMEKSFQNTGVDFYKSLKVIESELIEIGALDGDTKEDYLNSFQSLLRDEDNVEWRNYYNKYLLLEKKSLKGFNLKFNRFKFLGICSNIDPRFEKIKCDPTTVQRYLINQFVQKPFDDNDLLDGLFLFTDFEDDYLRLNVTYLLLLNMEKRFNSKVKSD